jgi:hypothetical protein
MGRILAIVVCLSGCAGTTRIEDMRPQVDLSPVGCGYKWFQSGYSPTVEIPCDRDRAPMREEQTALARADAWEIAEERCPDACGPIELRDTVASEDRFPNGVCRNGYAYFSTRVFFQCGQ